ncbi:DUF4126 domain-containing protein [Desulfuromonas acetoxidans]|uniref:DUF4126 domain-containing protein n=1 Tax=Desulfuromonas acetoxidans TaxID=891 RepID=UPI00293149B8|nr:DUF4126 domain-containing protein [Desulfuromonas acetoxidans]
MDQLDQITAVIALSMGAAWASGINLYATILVLGLMGNSGTMVLPQTLQIVQEPIVIGASALMYVVEFFADKFPGVDTGWDTIHTFIRIPAGAALAAAATGGVDPSISLAAAIVGGTLTAATHATKAGSRVLINTSPEPVTNWAASLSEDVVVIGGLWVALNHPLVFIGLLIVFILLLVWLLPKLWRGIKKVFAAIGRLFSGKKSAEVVQEPPQIEPPT